MYNQYLHPTSCHSPHITKNLRSSVISRIRRNCSDNVKDDQIFKDTLIEYKAYLMKSGYEEEHIDKIFVPFAVRKKRSDLLRPPGERINKERSKQIRKYRMVVDCEPTFRDITYSLQEI